jgi:superfamily II DNA or RNA helicase
MTGFSSFLNTFDAEAGKRGKQFEHFIKWFLKNDPQWATQVDQVWLWDEYPDSWGRDCGIDLVFKHKNGENWAVQAKCYAPTTSITKADVDSFISESNRDGIDKLLLIATTDLIGANAKQVCDAQDKKVTRYLLSHFDESDIEYPASIEDLPKAKPKNKPKPRAHQLEAIEAVSTNFKDIDRGQMIMACGTGKTFTTLWIKEKLRVDSTLVLLPSLGLLSQTLHEWTMAANEPFEVLCVCSDESVGKKGSDEAVHSIHDLAFPVTSNAAEIKAFLNRSVKKVIFSTYQSSPLIAEAQEDPLVPTFDLAIADEAHRCAGKVSGDFSTILDSQKIRAKKRLFTTATPRTYSSNVKKAAEDRGVEVVGMDDEAVFGKTLYALNFGEAIKRGLLTDYRVVIIGVDDPTISAWIENRELLKADSDIEMDAESLAAQVGLLKAIKDYDLHRMISFHSRVSRAEEFSKDIHKVIGWIDEKYKPSGELKSDFVSGEMPTDKRRKKLAQLKGLQDNQRGLLTNARCLSEGVDVPSLDGVAFIDPRSSQIDIIQAVGRAIRLSTNKQAGTIVLPVFISQSDDPEQALEEGNFKPIWDVLNALKAHDDVLADELNQIRTELGRKGGGKVDPDAFSKITMDLPVGIDKSFGDGLRTLLVEQATASWEYYFGLLEHYKSVNGDCYVKRGYKSANKYNLSSWVTHQRALLNKNELSLDRKGRLHAIGFDASPNDSFWESKYNLLKDYYEKNGTSNIGSRDPQRELARWVIKQRVKYREGKLTAHQVEKLNTIQFEFERKDFDRKNNVQLSYQEASSLVKKLHIPTMNKYQSWARGDHSMYGVFPDNLPRSPQQVYLNHGWVSWPSFLGNTNRDEQIEIDWNRMLDQYKTYISQFDEHPSFIKSSDKKFKNWVNTQRQYYRDNLLSERRLEELKKIGFIFSPKANQEAPSEN